MRLSTRAVTPIRAKATVFEYRILTFATLGIYYGEKYVKKRGPTPRFLIPYPIGFPFFSHTPVEKIYTRKNPDDTARILSKVRSSDGSRLSS